MVASFTPAIGCEVGFVGSNDIAIGRDGFGEDMNASADGANVDVMNKANTIISLGLTDDFIVVFSYDKSSWSALMK